MTEKPKEDYPALAAHFDRITPDWRSWPCPECLGAKVEKNGSPCRGCDGAGTWKLRK
jgi:hypothetical protein